MRLIDADALLEQIDTERDILAMDGRLGAEHILVHYVREFIEDAPTVDAVKATMPWTNPDGTETMLDEVSYEIGYSQGQKDAKRQGYWVRFYGDHIQMGLRLRWDCCSECGMVGTATRFCPHCGARMDGES